MPLGLLQFCLLLLKFSTIALKFVVLPSLSFLKVNLLEQEEYKRIPSLRYVLLFQSTEPHCRRSYICRNCNYTRLYLIILSSPLPIFFFCLLACLFVFLFVFFCSSVCVVGRRVFSPHYFLYCIMLNTNQERKVGTKTRFYCTPCSEWLGTGQEFSMWCTCYYN